eukprot:scaffold1404_cov37-Cyclotella_meneghiniana.AAC.12
MILWVCCVIAARSCSLAERLIWCHLFSTNDEASVTSEESCECVIWSKNGVGHIMRPHQSLYLGLRHMLGNTRILPVEIVTCMKIYCCCRGKPRGGRKPNTYLDDCCYPNWQHNYD